MSSCSLGSTGYLEQMHYEDGAFVKKGDLLFTIQQAPYKQQLEQAHAQVLTAQAALVYAKTEFARYTALVKQDAATQTEVDHWNFERASAAAQFAERAGPGRRSTRSISATPRSGRRLTASSASI